MDRATTHPHGDAVDAAAQRDALELLRSAERFLLVGHERPDGDCLGAQAALARVLEALGKTVAILNPDPPEDRYDFLAREVDFGVFAGTVPAHDVCVLLDISELSRCGRLGEVLAQAPSKKLVVDHHVHDGGPWWGRGLRRRDRVRHGAPVRRIARELGVPLDALAAKAIFTSLVTDTAGSSTATPTPRPSRSPGSWSPPASTPPRPTGPCSSGTGPTSRGRWARSCRTSPTTRTGAWR